jgi:hypothetical protein
MLVFINAEEREINLPKRLKLTRVSTACCGSERVESFRLPARLQQVVLTVVHKAGGLSTISAEALPFAGE